MVTMKKKPILALIIAAPSPLQDGLLALMTTSNQISAVFVAEEASLALRMVKDHRPILVLLDSYLPEAQTVLERIKSQWPQTRCIVLVGSVEQEREVKEADAVLIEGFSPSHLLATIEDLLAQSENR
jgi:DNA-binding NarL/FixJ family response regulator